MAITNERLEELTRHKMPYVRDMARELLSLRWRPITETDTPKVGDEVLGLADKVRRVDACDTLKTFKWWEKETFWTHFRPIAPPTDKGEQP